MLYVHIQTKDKEKKIYKKHQHYEGRTHGSITYILMN